MDRRAIACLVVGLVALAAFSSWLSLDLSSAFWPLLVLGLYFLPALAASSRRHRSRNAIAILNVFLGWTILGWLIALIWAGTGNIETAAAPTRKCPFCAEAIQPEARLCRFCGRPVSSTITAAGGES